MPTNAAGGVVWRQGRRKLKIALVHRRRYDDWTLPKGKLKHGEPTLLAAVREVAEETGFGVAVQEQLPEQRYPVDGSDKEIRYWSMRCVGGQFTPSDEVDQLRWTGPNKAAQWLTYPGDRAVVERFYAARRPDSMVLLARHASAGKRSRWHQPDDLRPLDSVGHRDAHEAARLIPVFAPEAVYAADLIRCVQTAEPVGAALGLPVTAARALSDEIYATHPGEALRALRDLAASHEVSYLCSQGLTIPGLLEELGVTASVDTGKGALWVLGFGDGELLFADYLRRPGR